MSLHPTPAAPAAFCRRRRGPFLALLALLAGTAACDLPQRPAPLPLVGCTPQTQTRLYFGAASPAGPVGDAAWEEFVDRTVTPRFAQGLTLLEARGQWRDARGTTAKEKSRVIELVHTDSTAARQALIEVIDSYKRRFGQEAVLLTQVPVRACL